jgi:hypothetical protein
MTSKYYFIPTDEIANYCKDMPVEILSTYTAEMREKFNAIKDEERCIYYTIYNERCENYQPATVQQHYNFINLLLEKLKLNNINKISCVSDEVPIPLLLLYIGLGVSSLSSFSKYIKYFLQSKYIFDWGKIMTSPQFDFKDKIQYYRYALSQKPEFNSVIPNIISSGSEQFESFEPLKWYLLKDIRGSGGGKIYPIYLNSENKFIIMNQDNSLNELNTSQINDFFIQKFITPCSVSGHTIIDILLKPSITITYDDILEESKSIQDENEKCITIYKECINTYGIDKLNSMLYALYFTNHSDEEYINYINLITVVISDLEGIIGTEEDYMVEIYKDSVDDYNSFIQFINLLKVFNTERRFYLKFRRPYLHFCSSEGNNSIKIFEKFDIDIIFDFEKNLSVSTNGDLLVVPPPDFTLFISNFTARNSIILDEICKIIDKKRGVYLLFDNFFTPEQKTKILSEEKIILETLKDSIKVGVGILNYKGETFFPEESREIIKNKIFFKHYANDYIIDNNLKLWMLETNDSPIIQKNTDEFVDFLINFLIKDYEFRIGFWPQEGGYKFISKQEHKYISKYLKYKSKYLQLKYKN